MATEPRTTPNSINVMDENGLDALLAAVFTKIRDTYVPTKTFEAKVAEIVANTPSSGGGPGLFSFYIRESDGHLIMRYSGGSAPNARIDERGHLMITL